MSRAPRVASLRALVVGGATLLALGTVLSLAALLAITTRTRAALDREAATLLEEQRLVDRVNREVGRQLFEAANYLRDAQPDALARFRRGGEGVYAALRGYLFRELSVPQRLQVEQVKELHQALEVRAERAFEARRAGAAGASDAAALLRDSELLQAALDRFLVMRAADYRAARARSEASLRRLYTAAAAVSLAFALAALVSLRIVRRRLLEPLDELARTADRVGAGDLSARVAPRHGDELARVGERFNAMAEGVAALQGELRRSEERYRRLVEIAPDAVLVHVDGLIALANGAAVALLGAPHADALVGRSLADLAHPDADERARARLRGALAGAAAGELVELPFRRLDGAAVHGELVAAPFALETHAATLVLIRDVTARRRAELALRATEEQLRQAQKMEAVGRLAGGVAHDFNNLLTVISSYGEMLMSSMPADDPNREDVAEIRAAAARAATLTRQLLAFSRKQVVRPQTADLNEVVMDISTLLRRLIAEDVVLRTVLEPLPAVVRVDPSQLEQVLVNLVVNARDAMPDGGHVTIRTRLTTVPPDAPDPDGPPVGDWVLLAVEDDGVGMDAATRARIFEPFFTTKEVGKGTGLGLFTVYGIVSQCEGHLRVRSEVGAGSTFEVYLPQAPWVEEAEAARAEAPAPEGGSETILLVEDESTVRALAARVLRRSGFTVLEAQDGVDALRVAGAYDGAIHLLLTDVVMPGLGGREVASRVGATRPDLCVLYTSGYTEDEVLRRGVLAHTERFLPKPYAPRQLVARVREVLDAGRDEGRGDGGESGRESARAESADREG